MNRTRPQEVSRSTISWSVFSRSTGYFRKPRVVVSRRRISARTSSISGRQRQLRVTAGRPFFMIMGVAQTSRAPSAKSFCITGP